MGPEGALLALLGRYGLGADWLFPVEMLLAVAAVTPFLLAIIFVAAFRAVRQPDTIAFFHPYCHAGGGGERVLWEAIRTVQLRYPRLKCHVYTGDHVPGAEILATALAAFGLPPLPALVEFIPLRRRGWVEARRWPAFTLLGQSLGGALLGFEALTALVPEVYVDTMGYASAAPLFRVLGGSRTAAYVHYPTISSDMIHAVATGVTAFNNAAAIAKNPLRTRAKLLYYRLFAALYRLQGAFFEVVMVNSSWTKGHIRAVWRRDPIRVYPPCDVAQFLGFPLAPRRPLILSIAQYRPEKAHGLQIEAFARLLEVHPEHRAAGVRLVMVGGCRDEEDARRMAALTDLAKTLGVGDAVDVQRDVPFPQKAALLHDAVIGLHTMANEHFGIGVVEFMAAGAVPIGHNSGGPKQDIVVPALEPHHLAAPAADTPAGERPLDTAVGLLAATAEEYAAAMHFVLAMPEEARRGLQQRAREASERAFTAAAFATTFGDAMASLCGGTPAVYAAAEAGKKAD